MPIKVDYEIDGQRTNVQIDNATLAVIPDGFSARDFVRRSLRNLWYHMHDTEDMSIGEIISALSAEFGATHSATVRCATAWYAGRCAWERAY